MIRQRGYLAIELIIVLAVGLIMMAMGAIYYLNYLDDQTAQSAALRQKQVNSAVTSYIKANYSSISSVIGNNPSLKYPIALGTLESAGYLPPGFSTSKNIFGQNWAVVVMAPSTSMLRALVVTAGGQAIPEKILRKTAIKTGVEGGYISASNSTQAIGTQAAWNIAVSTYGLNPGAGHIASQITMTNPVQTSEFFYRSSVPGHPELNTMTTDILMNAKNITGAAVISGSTVLGSNASISNTLSTKTLTASGNISATNGTVSAKTVAATGAVTGSYVRGGLYTLGGTCSVPGAVGRSTDDSLLVCKSSAWSSASGGDAYVKLSSPSTSFPTKYSSSGIIPVVGSTVTTPFQIPIKGSITLTDTDYATVKNLSLGQVVTVTSSITGTCSYNSGSSMSSSDNWSTPTFATKGRTYKYQVINVTKTGITYKLTYSTGGSGESASTHCTWSSGLAAATANNTSSKDTTVSNYPLESISIFYGNY